MFEINYIFNAAFNDSIDWRKASCLLADAYHTPIMQDEFGKDNETVLEGIIVSHTPTMAELHSRSKTHNRQKRHDTIKHAKRRLELFKNTVNPTYLEAHPETAVLGRFKNKGPYTHEDSLYMSGFDTRKGHIRNRRKVDDGAEQLAEYYEDRQRELDAIAEAKRIEEANQRRVNEMRNFISTAIFEENISLENCEDELAYIQNCLERIKHNMIYHNYKLEKLNYLQQKLNELSSLSEEDACAMEYFINGL